MGKFYETNILGKEYGNKNDTSLWLEPVDYGSSLKKGEKLKLSFGSLAGKVELELLVESITPNSPCRGADEVARFRALTPIGQEFGTILRNPHKIDVFR